MTKCPQNHCFSPLCADGSNDAKINPEEGLHDYVVPKTLPVQVAEEAVECPVPDAAPEPDDVIVNDDDRFEAENVSNDERVDEENDRGYDHIMVNGKIRALYGNGWYTGTIQWYKSKFDEYRVLFPDGSDEYIEMNMED